MAVLPELVPGNVDDEPVPLQPSMRLWRSALLGPDAADIGELAVTPALEESGEDLTHGTAAAAGEVAEDRPVDLRKNLLRGLAEGVHVAAEGIDVHAPITIR